MAVLQFEFHGGYLDGLSLPAGRDASGLALPGDHYLFLTDRGRVGARFRETPPERRAEIGRLLKEWMNNIPEGTDAREHAQQLHKQLAQLGSQVYEVAGREERPEATIVHVRFVGEESEGATIGGPCDPMLVTLMAKLRFPEGRPNEADIAARDAILRELVGNSFRESGYASSDDPRWMGIFAEWENETLGRQRLRAAIERFLPGIEYTIEIMPASEA